MKYVSTRDQAPKLAFDEVLLAGLARDGGLYVPEAWPQFSAADIAAMKDLSYAETAVRVIRPFVEGSMTDAELEAIVADAYSHFDHPDVAPLKELGDNEYLMELFHGPTLAFKDQAMQFLGPLFDFVLNRSGRRVTIVGATSGDTGSAAIEACRDRDAIDIFILYPNGRVSDVQRRQMTTVASSNVHCIALEGTFDDCQSLVKGLFNDIAFRDRWRLSAVNSINWARIVAQIVYYFFAAVKVGAPDRPVSFAVPTGNFGNVFAGYAARKMGLQIDQLVVGSNRNDILTRFFETGTMKTEGVVPTISPSMDIQISSNFERLLHDILDGDGAWVRSLMEDFQAAGQFSIAEDLLRDLTSVFSGARFDDDQTRAVIGQLHRETGELIDPHSAVGIAAGRALRRDQSVPMIALATAHPAKFPDAVKAAAGVAPGLPAHLADLFERPERYEILANDRETVGAFIAGTLEGESAGTLEGESAGSLAS